MDIEEEFISRRVYKKYGYQLVKTYNKKFNITRTSGFTYPNGEYIGNSKAAYRLCYKQGIKPQTINGPIIRGEFESLPIEERVEKLLLGINHNLLFAPSCSIGFCEKDQKWYGWGRAIYGFGIGSKIKIGDCGFTPKNKTEMAKDMINFYIERDWLVTETKFDIEEKDNGIGIQITYMNKNMQEMTFWQPYPQKWGKGSWTAKTLNDAKKMAIDFSNGVS